MELVHPQIVMATVDGKRVKLQWTREWDAETGLALYVTVGEEAGAKRQTPGGDH